MRRRVFAFVTVGAVVAAVVVFVGGAGCSNANATDGNATTGDAMSAGALDEQTRKDLATVAAHRVYFGHHSVGRNILDGVAALAKEAGVAVALQEGPVGQNQDPASKFVDFEREALARDVEVAVVKLCYVDFTPTTDSAALMKLYRAMVERVQAQKPTLKFLHVTPPLYARPTDFTSQAKRALGRDLWEEQANLRRLEFADGLKAAWPPDTIFDLATVESTVPGDGRELHLVGNRQVPMLWPGYTDDGGHLNAAGQRVAAKAFLRALARALGG